MNPEKPNYVIFFHNIVTARDWDRFGCDAMIARGYGVKIIQCGYALGGVDFSSLEKASYRSVPQAETPQTRADIENIIRELTSKDIVLMLLPLIKNYVWVYREFGRLNLRYMILSLGLLPVKPNCCFVARQGLRNLSTCIIQLFMGMARRFKNRLVLIATIGPTYFLLPAPWLLIRAGTAGLFLPLTGISQWRSRVLDVESFDVGWARKLETTTVDTRCSDYAVFLDEATGYHSDTEITGEGGVSNPEKYYADIRLTFDKLEKELGLPIVIALHPKNPLSDSDITSLFGGRAVYRNVTPALVRESKCVIGHFSTSFSYAALYRKPTIFLSNSILDEGSLGSLIGYMASWFGQNVLDMTQYNKIKTVPVKMPSVDEGAYERYERHFLRAKTAQKGHVWESVADEFENGLV